MINLKSFKSLLLWMNVSFFYDFSEDYDDYDDSRYDFLWIYPVWSSLSLLNLLIYVFHKILLHQIFFSVVLYLILLGFQLQVRWNFWYFFHRSLKFFIFLILFPSLSIRLGYFYWSSLKFTNFFFCQLFSAIKPKKSKLLNLCCMF